jgi:RHS repeat-associated protein
VYRGGELIAVKQNTVVSWVHQDPIAKSKRVTNSSGAVVSTIEMDPWGGETSRSSNAAFQPRQFTSYTRDANASDDAMHRRYNRWHARFDQPDPYAGSYDLTNPQSFNRYSYVMNDPVNFVDPSGLDGVLGAWAGIYLNPPTGSVTVYGSNNNIIGGGFGAGDAGMRIVEDLPTEGNPEAGGGGAGADRRTLRTRVSWKGS